MASWHVNLISRSGKQLDSYTQDVGSSTKQAIFIDGVAADADTWAFTHTADETQARRDWISQFSKLIQTNISRMHNYSQTTRC
jgi:hypothetical protein